MAKWLGPKGIITTFGFSRTKSYKLLKMYMESGREYIRIGSQTRVPEEQFTEYLKELTKASMK